MLGEGLMARSMAQRLEVSERTVHKHLGNLYRKLDAHDRLSPYDAQRCWGCSRLPGRRLGRRRTQGGSSTHCWPGRIGRTLEDVKHHLVVKTRRRPPRATAHPGLDPVHHRQVGRRHVRERGGGRGAARAPVLGHPRVRARARRLGGARGPPRAGPDLPLGAAARGDPASRRAGTAVGRAAERRARAPARGRRCRPAREPRRGRSVGGSRPGPAQPPSGWTSPRPTRVETGTSWSPCSTPASTSSIPSCGARSPRRPTSSTSKVWTPRRSSATSWVPTTTPRTSWAMAPTSPGSSPPRVSRWIRASCLSAGSWLCASWPRCRPVTDGRARASSTTSTPRSSGPSTTGPR